MTYEKMHYSYMTDEDLDRVINSGLYLECYVKRCKQEKAKRAEQRNQRLKL